jgi:hypothetical protein
VLKTSGAIVQNVVVNDPDSNTSKLKVHSWKMFSRRLGRYPDAHACLGSKIGDVKDRTWWHTTGKARDQFNDAEDEIQQHLANVFMPKYRSIVYFDLFMIGQTEQSAIPTIMFFCVEKEPRKRAKEAIDKSQILVKLPGFRTGHIAREPIIGPLIQPASTDTSIGILDETSMYTEVYVDPAEPIRALGMPIYAKHSNGSWRRAVGYAVFKERKCFLMSVAHVFVKRANEDHEVIVDDDNDFDFGSDTGSEERDDSNMNTWSSTYSDSGTSTRSSEGT